ncbi:MAG: response regulator [Pseudoflavonifractor sp.]
MEQVLNVLLADDDMLVLEDLQSLVDWERLGLRVVCTAENGKTALEALEQYRPQIVIADIEMPLMDGLEFSRRAIALVPEVKILLLTAYSRFDYAKVAVSLGVSGYLLKHEIDRESLTAQLQKLRGEVLSGRQAQNLARRQAVEGLLSNLPGGSQQARLRQLLGGPIRALLLLCQKDRSLSEIQRGFDPAENQFRFRDEIAAAAPGQLLFFAVSPWQTVAFLELGEPRMDAEDIGRALAERFPISVLISDLCQDAAALMEQYSLLLQVGRCAHFWGSRRVVTCGSRVGRLAADGDRQQDLDQMERRLLLTEPAALAGEIDRCIDTCARDRYDFEGYLRLCDRILRVLGQLGHGAAFAREEGLTLEARFWGCTTADEVRALFRETAEFLTGEAREHYSPKVEQALAYLHKNFSRPITIEETAGALGVSGDHLARIFKRETKRTFVQYLAEYRMRVARLMLESGDYKIYEVADRVGYTTSQYFSMVFRKINGVSPSDCIPRQKV